MGVILLAEDGGYYCWRKMTETTINSFIQVFQITTDFERGKNKYYNYWFGNA